MKRALSFIFLVFTLLLVACEEGPFTSTSSMLVVSEKGHSSDYQEYWIKGYDPNNQTKEESFKVIVQEEMAWHLIEENKEYISSYTKEGDGDWVLGQIEPKGTDKE
ncbi:hypothetical protein FZC78_19540 [Rossellomorea vietnamensis]|uniref:Uncharacterized protein n=1 Tax=Rossellomorea vietnamensis TaxID=218284 RepID=A0A5D4NJ68_9BACI|nr:hypothetical protein [Rossellomorea vietnamensis]TYS14050.1 hypothetical protein FZC78_19540 [Rossellomorea vietnamensis]